ncbi:hypothetical protein ACFO4E_03520 [Nocardiopsis mangrovi]|uniref:Uncharacterized protein n=1 Tax=Nocardiopsis mangrovi TaxID=1179818 RepID=A0ABV9DPS2_9ACTN
MSDPYAADRYSGDPRDADRYAVDPRDADRYAVDPRDAELYGTAPRRRKRTFGRTVRAVVGTFLGVAFFVPVATILLTVIWPGEAVYTAPLFCAEPTPEAVVVADFYPHEGGTAGDFTLYCVGDRGQRTRIGWMPPFIALSTAHVLIVLPMALAGVLRSDPRDGRPTDDEDARS